MFRFLLRLALVALVLSPLLAAPAPKPLLFRIEGTGVKTSYLFGTAHLGDDAVAGMLDTVGKTLESCDAVYTEIPMDKGSQMAAAMSLLGGSKSLSDVLPKDLYERSEAELQRINPVLTLAPFERMEVWALAVTISLLEEQFKNPGRQPLDGLIYERGEAAGKTVGGLETVAEQLGVFKSFNTAEQIEMLRSTLDDMEKARKDGKKPIDDLRTAYLAGDLSRLERVMVDWTGSIKEPLRSRLMDALLAKRNVRMAATMQTKLKESPAKACFFAVGAGHLGGKQGLIELLQKAGYKVTRVP